MSKLDHYINLWELADPQKIADTPTSTVYKVHKDDKTLILKILTDLGQDCEENGAAFLEACNGHGAVPLHQHDKGAMLIDFIDGPELISLVHEGKDDEATAIMGKLSKQHHAIKLTDDHPFTGLEVRFDALFKHEKDAPDIIKRGKAFAKIMLQDQHNIGLMHGDLHHKNVMLHKSKGWMVLDPQPHIGDIAYSVANILHNPDKMPALTEDKDRLTRQAMILGDIIGVDSKRIIRYAFLHGCLSACWTYENDGYYCPLALKTSAILEDLKG